MILSLSSFHLCFCLHLGVLLDDLSDKSVEGQIKDFTIISKKNRDFLSQSTSTKLQHLIPLGTVHCHEDSLLSELQKHVLSLIHDQLPTIRKLISSALSQGRPDIYASIFNDSSSDTTVKGSEGKYYTSITNQNDIGTCSLNNAMKKLKFYDTLSSDHLLLRALNHNYLPGTCYWNFHNSEIQTDKHLTNKRSSADIQGSEITKKKHQPLIVSNRIKAKKLSILENQSNLGESTVNNVNVKGYVENVKANDKVDTTLKTVGMVYSLGNKGRKKKGKVTKLTNSLAAGNIDNYIVKNIPTGLVVQILDQPQQLYKRVIDENSINSLFNDKDNFSVERVINSVIHDKVIADISLDNSVTQIDALNQTRIINNKMNTVQIWCQALEFKDEKAVSSDMNSKSIEMFPVWPPVEFSLPYDDDDKSVTINNALSSNTKISNIPVFASSDEPVLRLDSYADDSPDIENRICKDLKSLKLLFSKKFNIPMDDVIIFKFYKNDYVWLEFIPNLKVQVSAFKPSAITQKLMIEYLDSLLESNANYKMNFDRIIEKSDSGNDKAASTVLLSKSKKKSIKSKETTTNALSNMYANLYDVKGKRIIQTKKVKGGIFDPPYCVKEGDLFCVVDRRKLESMHTYVDSVISQIKDIEIHRDSKINVGVNSAIDETNLKSSEDLLYPLNRGHTDMLIEPESVEINQYNGNLALNLPEDEVNSISMIKSKYSQVSVISEVEPPKLSEAHIVDYSDNDVEDNESKIKLMLSCNLPVMLFPGGLADISSDSCGFSLVRREDMIMNIFHDEYIVKQQLLKSFGPSNLYKYDKKLNKSSSTGPSRPEVSLSLGNLDFSDDDNDEIE